MVDVDGVRVEVRSDSGGWMHIRGNLKSIEWGVVVFADGGRCWVAGWGLRSLIFAGKMLSERETCCFVESEGMGSSSAPLGGAASLRSNQSGNGVVGHICR